MLKNKNIINPILNIVSNAILSFSTFIIGIIFIKQNMLSYYGEFVFLTSIILVVSGFIYSTYTTYYILNINDSNIFLLLSNSLLLLIISSFIINILLNNQYLYIIIIALLYAYFDFNRQYHISRQNLFFVLLNDIILSTFKITIVYLFVNKIILLNNTIPQLLLYIVLLPFSIYLYYYLILQYKHRVLTSYNVINILYKTKWSFYENIASNFNSQIYIFAIKIFFGNTILGLYSSLNAIYSILNMFFTGISQYFLPQLRKLYLDNELYTFLKLAKKIKIVYLVLSLIVIFIVYIFSYEIYSIIYTANLYYQIKDYIVFFSILYFTRIMFIYYTVVCKSIGFYKTSFFANLYSSILILIIFYPILHFYNTIYGIIMIQFAGAILATYILFKKFNNEITI